MTVCWEAAHKEPCEVDRSGVVSGQGVGLEMFFFVFVSPLKNNMEHVLMEVWKIIFLSKWVICRFHVNLPRCFCLPKCDLSGGE